MRTTTERRQLLRRVMTIAWDLFRCDRNRGFPDALRGAWAWVNRTAERQAEAARFMQRAAGGHIRFGSLVQSPIRRSLGAAPYARVTAERAGYLTNRLGY